MDIEVANRDKLKSIFHECFVEGKLDISGSCSDFIRQELKYKVPRAALTDSIAIYNVDDMLIITEPETAQAMADKYKEVIKTVLRKY